MTAPTALRPLAVQLYSVRDILQTDYVATIDQIAGIGFSGVEYAGLYYESPARSAELCRSAGLEVVAAHVPLPLGDQKNAVLDTVGELGTKRIVCAYIPPEEFSSVDSIKRICETLNEADLIARSNGLELLYHNHWWEYQRLPEGGEYAYVVMHEHLSPTIHYEIDAYWVRVGGASVPQVLHDLGDRVALLHVKDGPGSPEQAMLPVGDGIMNYHEIIPTAAAAQWLIVELDRCDSDMLEAIRKSARYL
ncbi:MAG: sugar phosphate isomerase/epimerase, partial [Anaerolinea sp.]|nr:sugar phosphate isomerase/epimerase [Anaerolinea sp.]